MCGYLVRRDIAPITVPEKRGLRSCESEPGRRLVLAGVPLAVLLAFGLSWVDAQTSPCTDPDQSNYCRTVGEPGQVSCSDISCCDAVCFCYPEYCTVGWDATRVDAGEWTRIARGEPQSARRTCRRLHLR